MKHMKQILTLCAITLIALILPGCSADLVGTALPAASPVPYAMTEPAADADQSMQTEPSRQEPPVLTITIGEESLSPMRGAYDWTFEISDGTWRTEAADSAHPLDAREELPFVTIDPAIQQSAAWTFDFNQPPDSVQIFCWDDTHRGDPAAECEEIPAEAGAFALKAGTYLYEIVAKWTDTARCGGTVHYAFRTESALTGTQLTIRSGAETVVPYRFFLHSLTWTEHGLLYGDGLSLSDAMPALAQSDALPAVHYANDFSIAHAPEVRVDQIVLYDADFMPLEGCVESLGAASPGLYYVAVSCTQFGEYIEQVQTREYSSWADVFAVQVGADEKGD